MIRVATLFSGVGTPEQSLKHLKVEHETVFACEIDKYARTTYLANNQEPKTFYDDVKKLDATKYLNKIDILIWGFPCTSFSLAGKQLGFNDPNTGDLFAQGKLNQNVLTHIEQQYAWNVGQLQSEFNIPSVQEMESIKNMWTSLLQYNNHFVRDFKYGNSNYNKIV